MDDLSRKPLGIKAYGSIPHLPGSRRGPGDKGLSKEQASICLEKLRDKYDTVIVQEKLDGSNCAVAKINGLIVPLVRSGYIASSSPHKQHHYFACWVRKNEKRFCALLDEGERCIGEWLSQAHSTRYELPHEPFVIFDIMTKYKRINFDELQKKCYDFIIPRLIHYGEPISIESVLDILEPSGHGAIDPVEGAVWRVERKGNVDFLAKYVRHDKIDGAYFPQYTGNPIVWNWKPKKECAYG